MAFDGYYLKFGNAIFPNSLLIEESYSCTPDQKIVIDSYIDVNRNEHRDISSSRRATVSVTTKAYLTTQEQNQMISIMRQGLLNEIEGRYKVSFWNPNIDGYSTMEAFLSDIEYVVAMQLDSGPVYAGITIELEQNRG
ncbi:hypothetical protein MCG98_16465 [Ruminococcus sp. OA3]|uniref:DUF6711 family protein n=1 Tax=Ruminococcus sp. OA3 TaxID=2914164 RepID=UPI001F06C5C6|nr:DUF6711 family protein [Ruminococcus sp. OA3]MCH1984161.1 hypothetical protein [Ruminococcus sp. OA3]